MAEHTEPPWSSDVAGIIYAVNARPGQTTVAKLDAGAPAELLAAAPDLLRAVEAAMDGLEREFTRLSPGARRNAVLDARNGAETAIELVKVGGAARRRSWTVEATLPEGERKANERLLDAAPSLLAAAKKAYAALAGHVSDDDGTVDALHQAISRAS